MRTIQHDGCVNAIDLPAEVAPAYQWLRTHLKRVLPGYTGKPLWWFHCTKPDLRHFRHWSPRGVRYVRIGADIQSNRLFAFPSWAWHLVFCQNYLALSQDEYRTWRDAVEAAVPDENEWPLPNPWRQRLEGSWQRLFTELRAVPWKGYSDETLVDLQGCEAVVETIYQNDIRSITHFAGTSRLLLKCWKSRPAGSSP